MISLKRNLFLHLKNMPGWRTKRKVVVFSIDDFGNIRLASKKARENLIKAGVNLSRNRFDKYDSLETASDLSALFDVLTSVKDMNGRNVILTAFALPANIDFDRMEAESFQTYHYELLPDTLSKLKGYEGAWKLWQEGIRSKIFIPQFHGREHVNLKLLNHFLKEKNQLALACLKEKSWAGLDISPYKTIDYVSAFSFESFDEVGELADIVKDGLHVFEKVFGYKASHFNAPGSPAHSSIEKTLAAGGIRYVDSTLIKNEHQGNNRFSRKVNYLGKQNEWGQYYQIRNCVFEPLLNKNIDWVAHTLKEIEIAFRWNKPAIISSHRVNFCGYIDESVRTHGLHEFKRLVKSIVNTWPDVEFMPADELGRLIEESSRK